jgi:hypothetical protein
VSTIPLDARAARHQGEGVDLLRRERRFFTRAALVIAVLVAVGFGWSTYVRTRPGATAFGGPTLSPMVRLHAAVSTGWILLLIAQTWFVASRQTAVHKKLGLVGGLLAIGVVVCGWMVAVDTIKREVPRAREFFVLPASELFVFSILTALALYWRRVPRIHKRLMLLGTVALIPAATTRPVPPDSLLMILGLFGVPELLFVLALILHDARTLRRIHPATIAGAALVLVVAAFRMPLGSTSLWLAFASAVAR